MNLIAEFVMAQIYASIILGVVWSLYTTWLWFGFFCFVCYAPVVIIDKLLNGDSPPKTKGATE
jgi:hypothetical protein